MAAITKQKRRTPKRLTRKERVDAVFGGEDLLGERLVLADQRIERGADHGQRQLAHLLHAGEQLVKLFVELSHFG